LSEWSAASLLVEPLRNLFFELRLDDAIQMARILDFDDRPVLADRSEWSDSNLWSDVEGLAPVKTGMAINGL
jgi:hypothetical protein